MDLEALVSDATARIAAAPDSAALEAVRIEVLGRKAPLVLALRELGSLPPEERRTRGAELNRARVALEARARAAGGASWGRPSSSSACAPTGSTSRFRGCAGRAATRT